MSKLWLFGDSFTADDEKFYVVHDGPDKIAWSDELYKRRSWGKDLGALLGYEAINNARSGCSNYIILDTLIRNLHNIQPNDIVFVGTTRYQRYTYFNRNCLDSLEPINWGTRYELQRTVDPEDTWSTFSGAFKNMDHDRIKEIIDFYTNHNVEEDSHIYVHNEIICNRINDIANTIRSKFNARCFIWDSKIWEYPSKDTQEFDKDVAWGAHTVFETTYTWTKGMSHDGHWSPNGDLLAAYFFEYCVKQNIFNIDIKELAHWFMVYGKELKQSIEYIEFDKTLSIPQ